MASLEIWKDIPDYKGSYQVSNLGNVRSCIIKGHGGNTDTKHLLKPAINKFGYCVVTFSINNTRKTYKVHRLVLYAFVGIEKGKDVNHIDGNKQNNRLSNLEWNTKKENMNHAYTNGLVSTNKTSRPIKIIKGDVVIKRYPSIYTAAKKEGLQRSCINEVLTGRRKTHYGLKFEYDEAHRR